MCICGGCIYICRGPYFNVFLVALEAGTARYDGQYQLNQPDGLGVYSSSRGEVRV